MSIKHLNTCTAARSERRRPLGTTNQCSNTLILTNHTNNMQQRNTPTLPGGSSRSSSNNSSNSSNNNSRFPSKTLSTKA
jgi:hypothetical protein